MKIFQMRICAEILSYGAIRSSVFGPVYRLASPALYSAKVVYVLA
jgi:hypothetical protein